VRTAPYYYDYQLFAETHPDETSRVRIGVYGGADAFKTIQDRVVEDDPTIAGGNDLGLGYHRVQASYDAKPSKDLELSFMVSAGRNLEHAGFGRIRADDEIDIGSTRAEVGYRISPFLKVRTGWDVLVATAQVNLHLPYFGAPGEGSVPSLTTGRWATVDQRVTFFRPGGYVETELTPTERLSAVVGVRADGQTESRTFDVGPRMAIAYAARQEFPRTTLRAAAGLYHQPADPLDLLPGYGSTDLVSQRSRQASTGIDQEISHHLSLGLEAYGKRMDRLVSRVPSADGGYRLGNEGTGAAIGLEALLRYHDDPRFFGMVAYSLSRATRRENPHLPTQLYEHDQTHTLTMLGSVRLGRGWQLGARFRYITGLLYTPCKAGILDAASGTYACVPARPLSARLPDFHQLDVRVDKTWEFATWMLTAYLDVQNAYNRENAEGMTYGFDKSKREPTPGLPILPILGVRAEL
jgi:hypothetical protein